MFVLVGRENYVVCHKKVAVFFFFFQNATNIEKNPIKLQFLGVSINYCEAPVVIFFCPVRFMRIIFDSSGCCQEWLLCFSLWLLVRNISSPPSSKLIAPFSVELNWSSCLQGSVNAEQTFCDIPFQIVVVTSEEV